MPSNAALGKLSCITIEYGLEPESSGQENYFHCIANIYFICELNFSPIPSN
jgi:hypothetical protein